MLKLFISGMYKSRGPRNLLLNRILEDIRQCNACVNGKTSKNIIQSWFYGKNIL